MVYHPALFERSATGARLSGRPKHTNKEIERHLLKKAELLGWAVDKGTGSAT
jgi:hypothetical protein